MARHFSGFPVPAEAGVWPGRGKRRARWRTAPPAGMGFAVAKANPWRKPGFFRISGGGTAGAASLPGIISLITFGD